MSASAESTCSRLGSPSRRGPPILPSVKTLILTSRDMASLLDPIDAVNAVERAFALHGRGETRMPPKVYLPLPEFDGDFRAMPVFIPRLVVDNDARPAAGVKWINAHPRNPERHRLPSVVGVFILSDPETAHPLAIMDATEMTSLRTGAAAAVATKHLAREDASTLGIIGCGAQARSVIRCHAALRAWSEIHLFDVRADQARAVAADLTDLPCRVVDGDSAASADVVCTMTPSRTPVVRAERVRVGAHINALGADAPGKRELDVEILLRARVFLDDQEQARESGEVNVPLHDGRLAPESIAGTLGEVVAGKLPGRTADEEITVFDSTGLAVQDLAVAALADARASTRSVGTSVSLVGG
jgi:alanine dehydrogenase